MPMCSRELSLDFPSIDRSRFSLLLLLFSSGCGSARNVHSFFSMISFLKNDSELARPAERGFFSFFFVWQQLLLLLVRTTNLGIPISWWKIKEMGRWDGRRRIDETHQLVGSLASPICWQTKSVKKRRERENFLFDIFERVASGDPGGSGLSTLASLNCR